MLHNEIAFHSSIKIFVTIASVFWVSTASANLRFTAGLGMGSSTTKNEITQSEGPIVQKYTIDILIHSKLAIGAEQIRSLNLSPMSTAISFTGFFGRYYLNAAPVPYASSADAKPSEIVMRDICYYVGSGIGIGQSNLLSDQSGLSSNAAGFYISPRAGVEMSVTRKIGVQGELLTSMMVFGKGSISTFGLLGSLFYSF